NIARFYHLPHARFWSWAAVVGSTLLVIPLLPGCGSLRFTPRPAFGLKVQEEGGQLRISWNARAASGPARLDIFDGAEHTTVFVSGNMGTATYAPRTADIDVRLGPIQEGARPRLETVHYVRHVPQPLLIPEAKPPAAPRNSRPQRSRRTVSRVEESPPPAPPDAVAR